MIALLEPARAPGFVSGGYRYQDEVLRRLRAAGRGRQVAVEPRDLEEAVARHAACAAVVVVDGLFAALPGGRPLPAGATALLHAPPPRPDWCAAPPDVIATSAATADHVRKTARSVCVVRPGIDACFAPPAAPPANARPRLACIGTVCRHKGQRLVAAAVAAGSPCEIVFAGDVRSHPDEVAAVRAAAGATPVAFAGPIAPAAVAALLQGVDLLVSASRSESYSMAVAEAAACHTPVLAFAAGEIATFVADGTTGWLLPTDAPDAGFAALLQRLVASPARLAAARAAPRNGAARRSWDTVAAEFAAACARRR